LAQGRGTPAKREVFTQTDYSEPSDANQVRHLLAQLGLGQRAAARELEISERDMRGYCSGDKVPRVVMLALERLVDLQRRKCLISGGPCSHRIHVVSYCFR
jgi:hypothetical protein